MDWDPLRAAMVEDQLIPRGIHDERVLAAMRRIPRHLFIPEAQRSHAYEDRALPIGFEQTISQPLMVALMLQALALQGDEKVLEIGAGSGYQAALLGTLAREVHTVEIIPSLGYSAQHLLAAQSFRNVQVHSGDGSRGWREEAPYDAIIVAAAVPQIPPPLLEQLKSPGKLLIPLGQAPSEVLTLIEKKGPALTTREFGECAFVPLRGTYGIPKGC